MRGQDVRPSLFLYSYGVGSILETPDGPLLIQSIDRWGNIFEKPDILDVLGDYEIEDVRASAVFSDAKFFRLPTNADLKKPWFVKIFKGRPFPNWGLCLKQKHKKLFKIPPSGKSGCPICQIERDDRHGHKYAIRFVLACPNGHLQDLDWAWVVHRGQKCDNMVFDWIEEGNSLADIFIQCTKCESTRSLADIYNTKYQCPGFIAERYESEGCDANAVVVLRNASYLRVTELRSFLTIEPIDTELHVALSRKAERGILFQLKDEDKLRAVDIKKTFHRHAEIHKTISQDTYKLLENTENEEIEIASIDVLEKLKLPSSIKEAKGQELTALRRAVERGSPPSPTKRTPTLEVEKGSSELFPISDTIELRVTPIKRLRVVSIQIGYRRLVSSENIAPKLIDVAYFNQDKWYMAIEMLGEGVFIDLPANKTLQLHEDETYENWMKTYLAKRNDIDQQKHNPNYVWWHSLSHRVITALGIDSGYSSASIRERVYWGDDEMNDIGGILLYTSQPGTDGTLGGITALVPKFRRVLDAALTYVDTCSNDPLCAERKHSTGSSIGAACYSCLLVSETSCENRNLYLDRNLLVGNM
jgi:hypothetical protein